MQAGRGWTTFQNSNIETTVRPSFSRSSPTCDRYGCAAAGDREAALLGLAILSAGGRYGLHVNHAALMRQRHDLRSVWMLIGEWLGSHPPRLSAAGATATLRLQLPLTCERLGVDDVDGRARGPGYDLIEDVREVQLVLVARDVADVRRAHHVVEREQRIARVGERLAVVHVDRGHARAAPPQPRHQRARPAQPRPPPAYQQPRRL